MEDIFNDPSVVYGFSIVKRPGEEPEIKKFGSFPETTPENARRPLIDLLETEDQIHILAEMPGVEKEDIQLRITQNTLEIKTKGETKYAETIDLPSPVKPQPSKATYQNGILEILLEKQQ